METYGYQVFVDTKTIFGTACCLCESEDEVRDGPGTRVEETEASLGNTDLANHEGVSMNSSVAEGGEEG